MFSSNPLAMPLLLFGNHDDEVAEGLRPRNFLRPPHADQDPSKNEAFSAGGILSEIANSVGEANLAARKKLFDLMVCIEHRMERDPPHARVGELWTTKLENAADPVDNPSIPSGYTYLLQFIAHDMVDTVRSMSLAKGEAGTIVAAPAFRNARKRSLMLDTLYGDGPDENMQAFETTGSTAALPRTLFRTGDLRLENGNPPSPPEQRLFCPFKDLARSHPPEGEAQFLTEAHVTDSRNDSHALISQLTVLFHLLHNTIMDATPKPEPAGAAVAPENAYRLFTCARFATTLIYRNIIERDVLPRILNKAVCDAYSTNDQLPLDDASDVPAEFFAGAFRFGHAMVRQNYVANRSSGSLPFFEALRLSSRRNNAPVTKRWAVDWSLFFGNLDAAGPTNPSRRIGPCYAGGLMQEGSKTDGQTVEGLEFTDHGLPSRDLLTSSYSGLWSVPALFAEIGKRLETKQLGGLIPPFSVWADPLRRWLKGAGDSRLTDAQIELIVKDPPLPFFVLFEAAHDLDAQGRPITAAYDLPPHQFVGQGGSKLGRFGSILVADPIFNALHGKPFGIELKGLSLQQQIAGVCQALLEQPDALNDITFSDGAERKLDSMPGLLALLSERGQFA